MSVFWHDPSEPTAYRTSRRSRSSRTVQGSIQGDSTCPRLRLQANDRRTGEGILALQVFRGEHRLCAGEAHETPPGKVLVAAVDGIGEHSFHCMGAQRVEERRP